MEIENYAVYKAPPGTKAYDEAQKIMAARKSAYAARVAFSRQRAATGLYASEAHVSGLLYKKDAPLPEGWKKDFDYDDDTIVAQTDRRTKRGRSEQAMMTALPQMPGNDKFTDNIGAKWVFLGRVVRYCSFDLFGEELFVMVPFKDPDASTLSYEPEGCERVPYSVYYAAKEAEEAQRKATP